MYQIAIHVCCRKLRNNSIHAIHCYSLQCSMIGRDVNISVIIHQPDHVFEVCMSMRCRLEKLFEVHSLFLFHCLLVKNNCLQYQFSCLLACLLMSLALSGQLNNGISRILNRNSLNGLYILSLSSQEKKTNLRDRENFW